MSSSEVIPPLLIVLDEGDNSVDKDMQKSGSNRWYESRLGM